MDALAEKLDSKLRTWKPETAAAVRVHVAEVIELADGDTLDLMRSRFREQEVLDMLDEPTTLSDAERIAIIGRTAGSLTEAEGEELNRIIEKGCEQVDE